MRPLARTLLLLALLAYVSGNLLLRFGARRAQFVWPAPLLPLLAFLPRPVRLPAVLLALLLLQHFFFGGLQYAPQMLLGARVTLRPLCAPLVGADAVAVVVLWGGDARRLLHIAVELDYAGLNYTVARGYAGPIEARYEETCYRSSRSARGALRAAIAENRPWVLYLEDDAVPHRDFRRQLLCEVGADVVWLDARTDVTNKIDGVAVNVAGVLVTREAAAVWADSMEEDTPWMNRSRKGGWRGSYSQDWILNYRCSDGTLRCRVRPLVSEAGFVSTVWE